MRIGVVFPQTEIGSDVGTIRDFARTVERAGYHHLAVYDHVLGHRPVDPESWSNIGPYTDKHSFHEVFVLLAYLAACTERIGLVTSVLILPQRQAVLVAKQAAELQLLSGGRLRLGVGVGWNFEEYRALGMNFRDRGKRISEQVKVMRMLWDDDLVTFQGLEHSINASGINPRPSARIPVWIGGSAAVVIKRAATIGDGFMLDEDLEQAPVVLAHLQRELQAVGRDPSAFGVAATLQLEQDGVDESVQRAAAWKAVGVSELSVVTMDAGISRPRDHAQLALDFMHSWQSLKP